MLRHRELLCVVREILSLIIFNNYKEAVQQHKFMLNSFVIFGTSEDGRGPEVKQFHS
jgi:hypothetical protein